MALNIGVLGLQGAFAEHERALRRAEPSVTTRIVRRREELEGLDGLIIPGGESTTMAIIAERHGLMEALRGWVRDRRPVMGTCAGLIMLADEVAATKQNGQSHIGGLACRVHRNYYGAQTDSFLADLAVDATVGSEFTGVFIRAPLIESVLSSEVRILASLHCDGRGEGQPVAVQQGNLLGMTFHPELTDSSAWHAYFLDLVRRHKQQG